MQMYGILGIKKILNYPIVQIKTLGFPLWLRVNYRFGLIQAKQTIVRDKEELERIKRKGC